MSDPASERDAGALLQKLIVVGLVLIAAFGLFTAIVRGIFSLVLRGGPENGIYILFFGGAVVLIVLAGIGGGAAILLARRKAATPPADAKPAGPLSRGLTLGLVTVVAAVVFYLALFLWGWVKMR